MSALIRSVRSFEATSSRYALLTVSLSLALASTSRAAFAADPPASSSASASSASPSGAPPAPTAAARAAAAAAAKKASDEAARNYKLGLYERALPYYQAAFDRDGKAADGLLALDCARKTGDSATAFDLATKLADNKKLSKKDRATVEDALHEIQATTGTIQIAAPQGANIEIAGRPVGSAPLAQAPRLAVGTVLVRVTAPDKTPWEQPVAVAAGKETTVTATLAAATKGALVFVTEAKGRAVHVYLDDKDVGAAPWHGRTTPGAHRLTVKGDKLASSTSLVDLEDGTQQSVALTATPTVGSLRINVTPPSAVTTVDSAPVPFEARGNVEVPVGSHHVTATLDRYEPAAKDVEVGPGEVTDVQMPLTLINPDDLIDYTGMYGSFALNYLQPFKKPTLCATGGADSSCSNAAYAGGFTLRLGYNTGILGIELAIAPMGAYYKQTLGHSAVQATATAAAIAGGDETLSVYRVGGFAGLGPRLTSHGSTFRFTGGVQFGVAFADYFAHRSFNSTSLESDGTHVFSPAGMADLGILIGSTPGTKFFIGPVAYLELQKATDLQATSADFAAPVGWTGSAAFFFGGTIGMFFGH